MEAIYDILFLNAVNNKFHSYQPMLLISNSKYRKEYHFHVLKFEGNEINCDRESAAFKNSYNGRHDVIKFKFSKPDLANL